MTGATGDTVCTSDGRRLTLGALLKSGGAGSVYRLRDHPDQVAKLYHGDVDHPVYERKVTAMLKLSPQLPELGDHQRRYVQIAWPTAVLRDAGGRFLGFLMPAIDIQATSELELIMQERQARAAGLPTGLGAKATLAANLAAVIAELHRQQHRVVDLKPVNLRFYPQSLYMAMLDCDGFSIQGEGERFPAPQYTSDYLAPEFHAGGMTVAGEEQQDRFALAVIVFQLLNFGIHPFTGRPTAEHVPTDVPGRIAARLHAYGVRPHPHLQPNPASGHQAMPSELRAMFDRAFDGSAAARPTPGEWAAMLRSYAQRASARLVACTRNKDHQHFAGLPCAACARAALIARATQLAEAPARPAVSVRAGQATPKRAPAARPSLLKRPPLPKSVLRHARSVYAASAPSPSPTPSPLSWTPPPTPPPRKARSPKSRGLLATIVIWYHNLFGVRGWAVLLVILWFVINADDPQVAREPSEFLPPPASRADMQPAPAAYALPPGDTDLLPPAWRDGLGQARELSLAVAGAMADGNQGLVDRGMARLRVVGAGLPRVSADRIDDDRFLAFARTTGPANAAERLAIRRAAGAALAAHPADAEAACEWAWLTLLSGDRDAATDAFVRALWSNPDRACGWAGLGIVATDDNVALGALTMAEALRTHSDAEAREIADFTINVLGEAGLDRTRWTTMQAEAGTRMAAARAPEPAAAETAVRPDK